MTGLTIVCKVEIYSSGSSSLCIQTTSATFCVKTVCYLFQSDNICVEVFFIVALIFRSLCFFLWRLSAESGAKFLLHSNRHSTWYGILRLLFHVSRLCRGKFALYDDTSDRADSPSSWALRADLGVFFLSLSLYLSLPDSHHRAKLLKIDAL